ncbi:MAG: UDP-N-acetylmuramate dehydrogenase [Clostridia bacterium]|nr:UDP-N-acetylmuramate dehydrogenase [Clostridia bacterium]
MQLTLLARELQQALKGEVKLNQPLGAFTTWRLGGPADLFYQPLNQEELVKCLNFARQKGLPMHIMGNGSNILVLDRGVRGLVLHTRHWRQIKFGEGFLYAGAGALISELLRVAVRQEMGGLEFAAGIPATIGGAAVTNAGTPEGCLADIIRGVELVTLKGETRYLARQNISFAYRSSSLRREGLVTAVELQLVASRADDIRAMIKANLARRRQKQPLNWPNAGSVFKNPPGHFAGQLIEEAGAKGWRVGQAEVSTKHANFIINRGQATAAEVIELINRVREAVAKKSGITLELEIEIWG